MSEKQERIVCAAIRYEAFQLESDEIIDITIMGINYDHAIECNIAGYAEPLDNIELGFTTSKKRFVSPSEALRIALDAKQLSKETIDRMIYECAITLKPEDLY